MKFSILAVVVVAGFVLVGLGGSEALAGDTYAVDKIHSAVGFKVQHKGAGYVVGRFNDFEGQFVIDRKNPAKSSIELTVKSGSVDTAFEKRDQHLKSPDFFNAKQFPVITFKSKQIKQVKGETAHVTGDLTLLGVTKSVTAQAKHIGTMGELAGFEAQVEIKRSDFGMKFMLPHLGDKIVIDISVEGAKK